MIEIIIISLAVLATILGGLLALKFTRFQHHFNGFAAGILLGAAFFEVIPEAVELGDAHLIMRMVLLGFFVFYLLQRFTIIHACKHGDESIDAHTHHIGVIGAIGLAFHRFLDGAAVGLGFAVDPLLGIAIGLAVIAHGFGDGISTVTVMLKHKNNRQRTLTLLIVGAVAPLLGALLALNITLSQKLLAVLLAFFAGFFIYMSTSDLLPEAHHDNHKYSVLIATVIGALLVFAASNILH